MKEYFRNQSVLAYVAAVVPLLVLAMVSLPESVPPKGAIAAAFLVCALILCAVLHVGWFRHVDYPYPIHRRKAIVLWTYATPIAVLVAMLSLQDPGPPWVQPVVYLLTFFLLTTITFGILPGYGGAYNEYWELEQRRGRVRGSEKRIAETRFYSDSTIESVAEVCQTCLSAVLPEDETCWRCGNTIRWKTRFKKRWTEDRRSRWRKKKVSGHVLWERTWYPDYVRVDERGQLDDDFRVPRLFAFVYQDGRWALFAFVDTYPKVMLHPVTIDEGTEMSPRAARRRVNRRIDDVDFEKIFPNH
jgi:hypothetical protein